MRNFEVYGTHDQNTLNQMQKCMEHGSAVHGVLCADGHYGYAHPIGGVVAYDEHISVSGVGYDIACGNMAVKLDTRFTDISDNVATILEDISKVVLFGMGRVNPNAPDNALFDSDLWTNADVQNLKEMARVQLGTCGSGNHYVDLFEDEDGFVWIGVHFGSRGLGHKITTKFLDLINAKDSMDADPALICRHSEIGRAYMSGIKLGGLYAYAGREWVVEQVRGIIGGTILDTVHNHHNFAWEETHFGRDLVVVRKGATPASPGQRGFVGGSMGDYAVILEGVESPASEKALYSTIHGAGRVMSRMKARGKVHRKTGKRITDPAIDRVEWERNLTKKKITLIGGDLDEAPLAYRRLPDVLNEHIGTINILHQLRPFGVIMA